MPKYLILFNNNTMSQVIEAENLDEAEQAAYQAWREWAEDQADWHAEPLTKENAEEYGHEDEL